MIVAVRDERQTIAGKLRDLAALDYSADGLRFIVVDGGSTDGTVEIVKAHARRDDRIVLITAGTDGAPGKIAQLNEALSYVRAPWVLVSDADARMPPDTLRRLVSRAVLSPDVAALSTPLGLEDPHPLDRLHWQLSNWIRRLEHRAGTSGLVVAPCYLFRRALLTRFPDDSLADDVHIACLAAVAGARVALVEAEVRELRGPSSAFGWYRHKVRRTLGYLREVWRFMPQVRRMPGATRLVFLWRAGALTIGPIAGMTAIVAAAWAAGAGLSLAALAAFAIASAGCSRQPGASQAAAALQAAVLPFWILAVTATALVIYPVARPSARYAKHPLRTGAAGI